MPVAGRGKSLEGLASRVDSRLAHTLPSGLCPLFLSDPSFWSKVRQNGQDKGAVVWVWWIQHGSSDRRVGEAEPTVLVLYVHGKRRFSCCQPGYLHRL